MFVETPAPGWQTSWLNPHLPWSKHPILPADVADGLCKVMLARENLLEDVHYNKVVPNRYVVELSPSNYQHRYQPLGADLLNQWREKLAEALMTANSRQGRRLYRFAGQVHIELRSAEDVPDHTARVLLRVEPDSGPGAEQAQSDRRPAREPAGILEWINANRRFPLYPGDYTIGRDSSCDIFLDLPLVQQKRLVSGQHATLHVEGNRCILSDGNLSGRPSANGTYVNSRRITGEGTLLQEGDLVVLAALHPEDPRWDTPGAAAFRYQKAG